MPNCLIAGSWIDFGPHVHELFAHLHQMIGKTNTKLLETQLKYAFTAANDDTGLKEISEENLEALHKVSCKWLYFSVHVLPTQIFQWLFWSQGL